MILPRREEMEALEGSLTKFFAAAWSHMDSSEYQPHWSTDAICEHLEAVSRGDIKRLLINVPYRFGKTNLVSIAYQAWTWAQREKSFLRGPGVRFLCGSYNSELALKIATEARSLLESDWYQSFWGDRFGFSGVQNTKHDFANDKRGRRQSTSVGGTLLGLGGDIVIVDDPHRTGSEKKIEVESDTDRDATIRWWKELETTRLNSAKNSAIVVVMQRLHQEDVSGHILNNDKLTKDWVHLMIPMEYVPKRHCVTVLKRDDKGKPLRAWQDPRKVDRQLAWPERWGDKEVKSAKANLGPFLASGRLQQDPEVSTGGIIQRRWWQKWEEPEYPNFYYILASLDTANTEKQINDPSALTVWGLFNEAKTNIPKVMLIYAWEGREEIHTLVETVAAICHKASNKNKLPVLSYPVDKLVIEAKANGHSVSHELVRLYGNINAFSVELVDPSKWGDKVARAFGVQHMFADGMVYVPYTKPNGTHEPRKFAQPVIDQCAVFPYGSHDDWVDSMSAALRYLRLTGMLERKDEFAQRTQDEMTYKKPPEALYEVN